jgi:cytochrome c-type biogenesis protein CcmH/NrfF
VPSRRAEPRYSRRELLGLSLAALLPGALLQGRSVQEGDTAATRLYRPDMAGRPRERITDYENDPFIIGIEEQLRCTCGCNLDVYTCRTTDFTCGVSPAMHREVVGMVEQGRSGQEILDAFIAQHGEMVLMAPKKEGFNLAAYFVPGAAIVAVGSGLLWALSRRARLAAAQTAVGGGPATGVSDEEAAKLEAELSKLE